MKPLTTFVHAQTCRRFVAFVLVAAMLTFVAPTKSTTAEAAASGRRTPIAVLESGVARGISNDDIEEFRGLPYAAPPVSELRWRAPRRPARWRGIRDATTFAPVCPQVPASPNGQSEDCLYLNVYAPAAGWRAERRPVLVWIHGGGLGSGEGADYDATALAREGTVVVTINYRLGALGFLAHPALADSPGGPSGNYGLMDQQAALRWVRRNIWAFGGDPHNVTVAGQSAGGLSVLAQLASPSAAGLFDQAIVQSGSFALEQEPLADAEAAGAALSARVGCTDQTSACLRGVPVADLVADPQAPSTPGVVDGLVLQRSVGEALATGRFHRVPILNGTNHEEERIFTSLGRVVSHGATIPLPGPIDAGTFESVIAETFGVSPETSSTIAGEYPLEGYASPAHAFSALSSDANFACGALTVDRLASRHVDTYAYEFNDDAAPERFVPDTVGPPFAATHQSELQYLFGLPNAPLQGALSPDQETLAAAMREAWSTFAAEGRPSFGDARWPRFDGGRQRVVSLEAPHPSVIDDAASRHHCAFWDSLSG